MSLKLYIVIQVWLMTSVNCAAKYLFNNFNPGQIKNTDTWWGDQCHIHPVILLPAGADWPWARPVD